MGSRALDNVFKLNGFVSVTEPRFGAKGDGTTDDTASIQAAVTASNFVYFPAGTYYINGTIAVPASANLIGAGMLATTLVQHGTVTTSKGIFYGESSSSSTYLEGIHISDMTLDGRNTTTGFSEYQHLMSFAGVQHFLCERVKFLRFRGDGLILHGIGIDSGVERHNMNAVIRDCVFNGANKENRNGISIIDCDGCIIENNYFTQVAKSTMPGAIDVEPDANAFHVVRGIKIRGNRFDAIGGGVGAVSLVLGATNFTTFPTDFEISGNTFVSAAIAMSVSASNPAVSETTGKHRILIENNYATGVSRGVQIYGVSEVLVKNNRFTDTAGSLIGESLALDVKLIDNTFFQCGSSAGSGVGLNVGNVTRFLLQGNIFNDCGNVAGSRNAVDFYTGTSDFVTIRDNLVIAPTGITTIAFQKEGAHTFTAGNNLFFNNTYTGLTNNFVSTRTYSVGNPQQVGALETSYGRSDLSKEVVATNALTTYSVGYFNTFFTGTAGASMAVTLPAGALSIDGVVYTVMSTVDRVNATWVSTGATFVGAPATLTANTPVRLQYHHATTQWFIV